MVVVHDGLDATVIDAKTEEPIEGAFVYDGFENNQPHILAQSDITGQLRLDPSIRLEFVVLAGEAIVHQGLWVCKGGYKPVLVGQRHGWNADFSPAMYHKLGALKLTHSELSTTDSCLDMLSRNTFQVIDLQ
jgi:hypothetical protein